MCEINKSKACRIKTANNQECQAVCDLTNYCYGWSRGKSGKMRKMCEFKTLDGWKFVEDKVYDSATKSTSFIHENTHLLGMGNGRGNFVCDQVNPVH